MSNRSVNSRSGRFISYILSYVRWVPKVYFVEANGEFGIVDHHPEVASRGRKSMFSKLFSLVTDSANKQAHACTRHFFQAGLIKYNTLRP
jgi:hypothetical protein